METSVVVLVIAIITVSVTKGLGLMQEAKLKGARALTTNSQINAIDGLVLWLETTRDLSLQNNNDSYALKDGDTIKNWYSITQQSPDSIAATQATQANQPTYKEDGINGLPALLFNGSNSHLAISNFADISPTSELTIFLVLKFQDITASGGVQGIISKDISTGIGNPAYEFTMGASGGTICFSTTSSSNVRNLRTSVAPTNNTVYIVYGYVSQNIPTIFVNKASYTGSSQTDIFPSTAALRIGQQKSGSSRFFSGYLSEIIMFKRALTTTEMNGVKKYLTKKYGIAL